MRRINFILSFLFLLGMTTQGQNIFYEDFNHIEYNSQGVGNLPASWVLHNDANQTKGAFSYIDKAWKTLKTPAKETVAVSTSWFTAPKVADRWLITPQIDLGQASAPFLIFKAAAADMSYNESYEVRISTGDSAKTSFQEVLLNTVTQGGDWKEISLDLSAYTGQKIRIAFILKSLDQYALYFDNIEIGDFETPLINIKSFVLPVFSGINQAVEIKGIAKSKTKDPIHKYVVNYTINDTAVVSTPVQGLNIPFLSDFAFVAQDFVPANRGTYVLKIWISDINENKGVFTDTLSQTIVISEDELYHRVALLEIFSSSTCSPCADANPHIHQGLKSIGYNKKDSKVIAVKYQVKVPYPGDPAFVSENALRFNYYEASGAPSLFLAGTRLQKSNLWNEFETLIPTEVEKKWANRTPFAINIEGHRLANQFFIKTSITNKAPYTGELALFVAFIEDSVYHTPQSNGEAVFYTVVRKMLPSAFGESLSFPNAAMQIEYDYNYTFDMSNPLIFNGVEGISVVAFLQDVNTKEVLQAAILPASTVVGNTKENTIIEGLRIYPNPVQNQVNISFFAKENTKARIGLYDIAGRPLDILNSQDYLEGQHLISFDIQNYSKGIYLVKIENSTNTLVKKIVVQ